MDIPSYRVNAGEVIAVKDKSKSQEHMKAISEAQPRPMPKWLEFDTEKLTGKIVGLPEETI